MAQVNDTELPHEWAITAKFLRFQAQHWSKSADRYWLYFDGGLAFGGTFVQTAYTGGFFFKFFGDMMSNYVFNHQGDVDRYLALLSDLVRMIYQIWERTEGQAERGIRIQRPYLNSVRALLEGLKSTADANYRVSDNRLEKVPATASSEINQRVDSQVLPAFQALIDQLDEDYERLAPDGVGISEYDGGREIYKELVKWNTTMDLTPEQVHECGVARMQKIEDEMASIRSALGFTGSSKQFAEFLRQRPGGVASEPYEIGQKMQYHKDRVNACFDDYFSQQSPYEFDLERLAPELEASMTWGYYSPPTKTESRGIYYYNGGKLDSQAVLGAGSLVFHELVPGHHLHMTLQRDNQSLIPIRRNAFINAYNEGWAEYAATLAGEMGLYDDPYDKYGRLIMDSFLTSRLVVDTGMNALGWTLEEAKSYMAEHTLCADEEIQSDALRYSCSIPAQALAYKLGDEEILRMRKKAQDSLGDSFDHSAFHSAVLNIGGVPLPVLEWHLDRFVEQKIAC